MENTGFGFGLFPKEKDNSSPFRGFSTFSSNNKQPENTNTFTLTSTVNEDHGDNQRLNFLNDVKQDDDHLSDNNNNNNANLSTKETLDNGYPKVHWYSGNSAHFVSSHTNIVHMQWDIPNTQQISLMRKLSEFSFVWCLSFHPCAKQQFFYFLIFYFCIFSLTILAPIIELSMKHK